MSLIVLLDRAVQTALLTISHDLVAKEVLYSKHPPIRVPSRNVFFGGKMVRGKCTLGRGLGPCPQENASVPLSKHIYSSVFTDRQELILCHYFKLQFGTKIGGKLEYLGEKLPPPSPVD